MLLKISGPMARQRVETAMQVWKGVGQGKGEGSGKALEVATALAFAPFATALDAADTQMIFCSELLAVHSCEQLEAASKETMPQRRANLPALASVCESPCHTTHTVGILQVLQ